MLNGGVLKFGRLAPRVRELIHFSLVGGLAYIVNFVIFNLLVHINTSTHKAPFAQRPVTGIVIAGVVSILVAFVGNRSLTWSHLTTGSVGREIALFFALNAVGLLISAGTLWISRYVLGFTSGLADNISGNVIGVGLGTLFRFWSYRRFVFIGDGTHHLKK